MYAMPLSPRPRRRSKINLPSWAIAIANRRLELDYLQVDIEEHSGEVVKQGSVSDMENGKYPPTSMTAERLTAYLKALRWTPQQFTEATGLNIPGTDVKNFTPRSLDLAGTVEFPVRSLRTPTEGGPVVLTQVFLGTHRAEDVFTIEAGGSLLACEAVKRELKSGYALFFDAAQTPAEGQPVIYRLEGQDRFMVTLYQKTLTPRWVTSYDGKDGEFIEPDKPPLELLGVYWRFIPPEGWPGEKTVNPS